MFFLQVELHATLTVSTIEDYFIFLTKTGLENESPGAKCAEIRPTSANRPCNGEQLNLKNPDGENNECRSILINCPLQAFTSVVLWFTTFKKLICMREFSISNVNLPYLPFSKEDLFRLAPQARLHEEVCYWLTDQVQARSTYTVRFEIMKKRMLVFHRVEFTFTKVLTN